MAQSEEIICNEILKIHECGINSVCLEARPHPDFCGEGWWRKDVDVVFEIAKKTQYEGLDFG